MNNDKEAYMDWRAKNKSILRGLPKKAIKELWIKERAKRAKISYSVKKTNERRVKQKVRVKELSERFSKYNSGEVFYTKDEYGRLKTGG